VWATLAVVSTLAFVATPAGAFVGVCANGFHCEGKPTCSSTADCPAGHACLFGTGCTACSEDIGVCVPPQNICNGGQGCSAPGNCTVGFTEGFGCGAADLSCQVESPVTLCYETDFIPKPGHPAPALSPHAGGALIVLLIALGLYRLWRRGDHSRLRA